jgi:regulator of replication initiation timing
LTKLDAVLRTKVVALQSNVKEMHREIDALKKTVTGLVKIVKALKKERRLRLKQGQKVVESAYLTLP